jgi:hypothetical protein
MRRRTVLFIAVLITLVGFALMGHGRKVNAQPQSDSACTVPKAWGAYKGYGQGFYIFEDAQGTLREFYSNGSCKEIRRQ